MGDPTYESDRLTIAIASRDDNTVVLNLSGQLETENSHKATETIGRVSNLSPRPDRLVLDLSSLVYASSTGIGSLSAILIECRKAGIKLHLANVGDNIRKVFDLLGFSAFFSFIDWPEE